MLVAAVPVVAVWIPQMYYWYYLSGNILLDSYAAESFIYWKNPKIGQVLTSSLNGYFTYNPVMVLPVACLPFLLKNNKLNSWAILLIFAISTYVYASWWCWWFGGAFGHRCYVELIAVLCFPLCFVVEKILVLRKAWIKTVSLAAIAILVYYNFHCTLIYEWTWSHFDWTAEKYWEEVFGKIFFM